MLACCHCLCNEDYNALSRIDACYPTDSRPDPISAHVRELIQWGLHDLGRFDSIHDIILNKVQRDIRQGKTNSIAVSTKILARLLERVRELNRNLSSALASAILQLIQNPRSEFLELAIQGTGFLMEYSLPMNRGHSVQRIITAYIPLCSKDSYRDTVLRALSEIVEQSSVEWIPISGLLRLAKDHLASSDATRTVIISLAHCLQPLTLPSFSESIVLFFDNESLWSQTAFIENLLVTLFSEMKDNCAPPLFRLWLEQLLPARQDEVKARAILGVAVRLMDELSAVKLLAQTQIDSLLTVYMFLIKMPPEFDRPPLQGNCFTLGHAIGRHFAASELARVAHRQIWGSLSSEDGAVVSDEETVCLIFKFTAIFNDAIASALTTQEVSESLQKTLAYLKACKEVSGEILAAILDHIKQLIAVFPDARVLCVLPFLIALQDAKRGHLKRTLGIHTFVICALKDVVASAKAGPREYIREVLEERRSANPPMIDFAMPFVAPYAQPPKKKKPKDKDQEFLYVDEGRLVENLERKHRKTVTRRIAAFGVDDLEEIEIEEPVDDVEGPEKEELFFTRPTISAMPSTAEVPILDEAGLREMEEKRGAALETIRVIKYQWKSILAREAPVA
jgi:hypothetical protein